MPALPASEFVTQAQAKGFVFSVKPDGSLGIKPPARGAMTEGMRRYVSAMKAELLQLLQTAPSVGEAPAPVPVPEIATEAPARPIYADERQALLDWAVNEARRCALPEPIESLQLFNGENTGDSLCAWLLSAHCRALALLSEPEGAVGLDFLYLRESMEEAALWAAGWVRWDRLTITHAGACSSLNGPDRGKYQL